MTKRIDQLDGIRAIAITAVFLHHAFDVKMLWAGVDLFFVLSGFLITGILLRAKQQPLKLYLAHFYKRRALRILPPYVLLLLVTSVLFGVGWASHWYLYLFLMNFAVALGVPHPYSLRLLWSLAVEEQFYLAWPFVIYFCGQRTIARIAAFLLLLAPILRWFCTPAMPRWGIYVLTPFRMDLLAAGALLAIVWACRPDLIRRFGCYGPVVSALAVVTLVLLGRRPGFNTFAHRPAPNVWIYELSLVACTGVILWALSGRGVGILTLGPVRYLGRISYTVYLIHTTVLGLCVQHLHSRGVVAFAAACIVLLYATVSWFVLEKPLMEAKPVPTPVPAEV